MTPLAKKFVKQIDYNGRLDEPYRIARVLGQQGMSFSVAALLLPNMSEALATGCLDHMSGLYEQLAELLRHQIK